ncbi:MAG: PQQ-dependent sugar dehydrogenase [Candidatus Shapirobacteria bacterium]
MKNIAMLTGVAFMVVTAMVATLISARNMPVTEPEKANNLVTEQITVVARNLATPWEMAFLPNGEILVTERGGRLIKISPSEKKVIAEIQEVAAVGEGGLMGIALHPNFEENGWIYLDYTYRSDSGLINRVSRYRLVDDQLAEEKVVMDNIKGGNNHNGGRIEFGPDGLLYIATGDAGESGLAQDENSLNGKILRVGDDGSIPVNNPFGNAVYSLGHRNVQGLTWDDRGELWASEHGPSGSASGEDEINRIVAGGNYGWPIITGEQRREGLISPALQSGKNMTWAPAGIIFLDGRLYWAGLRGEAIYSAVIDNGRLTNLTRQYTIYGRLRAIRLYSGDIYVTTSNRDGRGLPREGDDKIIKIIPTPQK